MSGVDVLCLVYPVFLFQFDRSSSMRFSSRRARTLESLASLYEVLWCFRPFFYSCRRNSAWLVTLIFDPEGIYIRFNVIYWHDRRRTSRTPWRKVLAFRGHTKSTLIKLSSTKTPTPRSAKWSNLWRSCLISINGFPSLGSTKKKRKIIRLNLIHLPSQLKSESHLSFASPSSDKHLRRAKYFRW